MSGLIIIPIYIIYVIVGFIVFKLILRLFKKRLNSIIILAIVIIFPFWDIFAANGILKILTYTTKPIIYEMPEKDKDGKIESIGDSLTLSYISIDELKDKKKLEKFKSYLREDNISEFIEYKLYSEKIAKIYLNPNSKKDYDIIEKSEAKYIGTYNRDFPKDSSFLGFTIFRSQFEVYDTKQNKIIAIAPTVGVGTPHFMNLFRGGILMLISGGGGAPMFSTKSIVTAWSLLEELFKDIRGVKK
ncbi:hypothetical protein CRU99_13605 [Malaciobacter mytili]|uniref:hypothetical protein n=1 Tax=Malaciobacter mytili TaxID=603050 RepID=UPI00100AE50B|nr:hypothetical protein [Malaciobacter mytili]RXI36128.1 hypothetical protein CRU99_13605 [Malaciobacter mytili]